MSKFLNQCLTEKQNFYFQGCRLQEVVAYEKWSLDESRRLHVVSDTRDNPPPEFP